MFFIYKKPDRCHGMLNCYYSITKFKTLNNETITLTDIPDVEGSGDFSVTKHF